MIPIISRMPTIIIPWVVGAHILKVVYDPSLSCLHINPGAAGISGFHVVRTLVRFVLQAGKVTDLEVIELGKRGG